MTKVLFPLIYPYEHNTKYWCFYSPSTGFNQSVVRNLIQKYHLYTETEIQVSGSERITMDLKVHKKLNKSRNQWVTQYRIVYINTVDRTVIRADSDHPYPHIDLELAGKKKVTNVFDSEPYDYEAGINTVLRYAEYYKNPNIGIDYWLSNLVSFKRESIYSLFGSNKSNLQPITSLTDIARLVSLSMLNAELQVRYDLEKLARLIISKFIECKNHESIHGRPLKISKNMLPNENGKVILPFFIQASSDIPVINKVLNIDGTESNIEKVDILGKTTYQD
jgi:hypothetical protein